MIIAIDHIAYSSLDVKTSIRDFLAKGYRLEFVETLPNLEIKKPFLSKYNKTHELALLTNNTGYNIEILNHGAMSGDEGYIKLVPDDEIIIRTDSIERSKDFYSKLGFKFKNTNDAIFSSILSGNKKLKLTLEQQNIEQNFKIDDAGFNCIGFITTNVEKDVANLKQFDCKISEIQELKVNSKLMKICFVQRANCEIVELIEIGRK